MAGGGERLYQGPRGDGRVRVESDQTEVPECGGGAGPFDRQRRRRSDGPGRQALLKPPPPLRTKRAR
eukprot:2224794-Pyramimonas_sp.AAC.1